MHSYSKQLYEHMATPTKHCTGTKGQISDPSICSPFIHNLLQVFIGSDVIVIGMVVGADPPTHTNPDPIK